MHMNTECVTLHTNDGAAIAADYYPADVDRGVILAHMMPADRKSWAALAGTLQAAGFRVIAIDLRGHGESQGGPVGYKKFSDAEHRASIQDVKAAAEALAERGASTIHLGGASIGANLVLQYAAEHEEVASAILLSPGLEYRGLATEAHARRIRKGQAIYYIAAEDDIYSAETVKKLFAVTPEYAEKELHVFPAGGHGTNLFKTHPELMEELTQWLTERT